jgi:hypothetical protein
MSAAVTLAFFKSKDWSSYMAAKNGGAVYSVSLDYPEAHKGLDQNAIYEAIDCISAAKKCFGIDDPLSFVLIDDEDRIVDFMNWRG